MAIKLIDLEAAEDEIDDIQKEIAMISACNSDYVTRYHASYIHGSTLWIVMEFVDGAPPSPQPPRLPLLPPPRTLGCGCGGLRNAIGE